MQYYWVAFESGSSGCVTAESKEDAIKLASEITGRQAVSADVLPYPAEPRINKVSVGNYGVCPSFCYDPRNCKGNASCRQRRSCVE